MSDLSKLMLACDECDKRVDEVRKRREAAHLALDTVTQEEAIVCAEALGLHRALMLVTPQHARDEQPSPAQETKPKEKTPPLPSAECAGAIQEWTERESLAAFTEAAAFAAFDGKYKNRTLRAALRILCKEQIITWLSPHQKYFTRNHDESATESRAASETVSDVNGKDQGSPSDTAPDRSGAGDQEDFGDIPKFLDRREPKAAAE